MWKFSHVPSQSARISSLRSMLSCDKRLLLETWNPPGLQENVFANPRSTLESSQIPYQGIHSFLTRSAAGEAPALISTRRPVAREEERIGSTIPMPTFARKSPTMSSSILVDIPQNSMVGPQRQQISELQFDKFTTPSSFLFWKISFKSQVTTCSDYPLCYGSKKYRWSIHWNNFAGCENCLCSEQDHPQFTLQKWRSISRKRTPSKKNGVYEEDRSLTWSTTTWEWLLLMIQF